MKVIFTNGCFDIVHIGHIKLLKEAKSFGDILIVGLNSDESVKKIKGASRPINNQNDRKQFLESIKYVDKVIIFNEQTPCRLIQELKPDIHVKGGDYNPNDYNNMPEAKIVHEYGGEVRIIKLLEGKSSSKILNILENKLDK